MQAAMLDFAARGSSTYEEGTYKSACKRRLDMIRSAANHTHRSLIIIPFVVFLKLAHGSNRRRGGWSGMYMYPALACRMAQPTVIGTPHMSLTRVHPPSPARIKPPLRLSERAARAPEVPPSFLFLFPP